MAGEFTPVGVHAVVRGADQFVKDMGKMRAAVTRFGTGATKTAPKINTLRTSVANLGVSVSVAAGTISRAAASINASIAGMGGSIAALQVASTGAATAATGAGAATAAGAAVSMGVLGRLGAAATVAGVAAGKAFGVMKTGLSTVGKAIVAPQRLFQGFFGVLGRANDRMKSFANSAFRMGNSLRFLGQSLTFFISVPIIGFMAGLVNGAIEFETAFTGVLKTVDGLVKEGTLLELTEHGELLREGLRKLSLIVPLPTAELVDLARIGGQLGVRGVINLLTFTRVAADMGAATDLAAEEAANAIGKVVGITGLLSNSQLVMAGWTGEVVDLAEATEEAGGELDELSEKSLRKYNQELSDTITQSERFQGTIEAVGGSLVALGNRVRGQEPAFLDFLQGIVGVGNALGFTIADLLGVSAAFVSVGANASSGTTAFNRLLIVTEKAIRDNGDQVKLWAAVTGRSINQFVEDFKAGGETLADLTVDMFEGLNAQGPEALAILDALDAATLRSVKNILPLVVAEGDLARAIDISREGFQVYGDTLETFNDLQVEALRRYATTESQLQLLRNEFTNLGITIGDFVLPKILDVVKKIRGAIEVFGKLSEESQALILKLLGIVAVIGPIIIAIGLLSSGLGFLGTVITSVIGVITFIGSALGLLAFPVAGLILLIGGLAVAWLASFNKINELTGQAEETLTQRMLRFGANIIIAFAQGMAAALTAVVLVLLALGSLIANFLQAFSPPKLLPDLPEWGRAAMESYLEGWLEADFGMFNDIAGIMESFIRSLGLADTAVVPAILEMRTAVAAAVEEFSELGQISVESMNAITEAVGASEEAVATYIQALAELAAANEAVAAAQEALDAITQQYEESLAPLNERLGEISDRQEEVRRELRIQELEEILADPRATDLVRELAALEIEQIGLEATVDDLEDAQEAEEAVAQSALEAAQAHAEAAEAQLAAAQAFLEVQIENNNLINEQIDLLDRLKKKEEEVAEKIGKVTDNLDDLIEGIQAGGPGADDPFGMEESIEDLRKQLDEMFEGLDTEGFTNLADDIDAEIKRITREVQKAFDPLIKAWDLLGDQWAITFTEIQRVWNEQSPGFFADIREKFTAAKLDMSLALVDLGLKDPPILQMEDIINIGEDGARLEIPAEVVITGQTSEGLGMRSVGAGPFQELVNGFQELRRDIEELANLPAIATLISQFEGFFSILETEFDLLDTTIGPALDQIGVAFQPLGETLDRLGQSLKDTGLVNLLSEVGGALLTLAGGVGLLVAGGAVTVLIGVINGLARAIELAAPFIIMIFEGVVEVVLGIYQFIAGIVGFFINIFAMIVNPTEKTADSLRQAARNIVEGVSRIFGGIIETVAGLAGTILTLIIGLFGGFAEGVLNAISAFLELIPGEFAENVGVIVDQVRETLTGVLHEVANGGQEILEAFGGLVDGIIGFFEDLWEDLVGGSIIPDMISDIITAIEGLVADVLFKIEEFVAGFVAFFVGLVVAIVTPLTDLYDTVTGWIQDIIDWVDTELPLFITAFIKFFTDLVVSIVTPLTDLYDTVTGWIQDIIDWVVENISGLPDAITGAIDSLVEWFTTATSEGGVIYNIGKKIVNAIIAGIQSRISALRRKLAELAALVGIDIGDELDEGSPYQVLVDIGEKIIDSMIVGMENAAERLSEALIAIAAIMATGAQIGTQAAVAPQVASAPGTVLPATAAAAAQGGSTINFGGQNITNAMDMAEFKIFVESVVREQL